MIDPLCRHTLPQSSYVTQDQRLEAQWIAPGRVDSSPRRHVRSVSQIFYQVVQPISNLHFKYANNSGRPCQILCQIPLMFSWILVISQKNFENIFTKSYKTTVFRSPHQNPLSKSSFKQIFWTFWFKAYDSTLFGILSPLQSNLISLNAYHSTDAIVRKSGNS